MHIAFLIWEYFGMHQPTNVNVGQYGDVYIANHAELANDFSVQAWTTHRDSVLSNGHYEDPV